MKTVKKVMGLGLVLGSSAFAADEVNVNGYVTTGFSYKDKGVYSFKFNEAALYLSHTSGAASFMLDVPVVGTTANSTGTAFAFDSKGQAYVDYKYENGWAWRMGQFDTIYGYEANDSIDRRFSSIGLIGSRMMPTVHTGALISYDLSESLKMQFLVANRFDVAQYSATPVRPDAGVKVATKVADFDVSLGGHVYQGIEGTLSNGSLVTKSKVYGKVGWLADFVTTGKVAGFDTAMELTFRQDPFTSGDKRPPAASGYLIQADYAMSDDMDIGGKFEGLVGAHDGEVDTTTYVAPAGAISNNVTFNKADRVRAFSFGPRFKMSKNMKVKTDYTFWDNKNGDIKTKEHRLGVSVGYRF